LRGAGICENNKRGNQSWNKLLVEGEKMKKLAILFFSLTLIASALAQEPAKPAQSDASIQVFWDKFKTAVIKEDKAAIADLSQFPIWMPYGMPKVKNKPQLIKRYRDVFHHDSDAAKCFTEAKPEVDQSRPGFTVACKNEAGDPVIIYSFGRSRNGWRFTGLDNINE
jgi:hypothetical protein